jgi:hypothetical protein
MMNLHAIKLLYGGNILESYCGSFVVFIVASTVLPESSSQSSWDIYPAVASLWWASPAQF